MTVTQPMTAERLAELRHRVGEAQTWYEWQPIALAHAIAELLSEVSRLAAENERLRSEITLLRQEIDEVRYKDTAEVDDLAAIGRLAALIHDQTEDAIARDAAMEIQNIVRGVEP